MKTQSPAPAVPTRKRATPRPKTAPTPPPGGTETAEQIKKSLKKRGLNGWEGYKCCVKGRNDASRFADETADALQWMYDTWSERHKPGEATLMSQVLPATRFIIRIPKGPAVRPIAAIQLLDPQPGAGWVDIADLPEPFTGHELEIAQKAARAIATRTRTKTEEACLPCIRSKLWGQKKRRRGVTILAWRTRTTKRRNPLPVGDARLCLRVPHR